MYNLRQNYITRDAAGVLKMFRSFLFSSQFDKPQLHRDCRLPPVLPQALSSPSTMCALLCVSARVCLSVRGGSWL